MYQFPQITTTQSSASQILAVQDICGVPKRSGKYFTIIPTSDILLSSAQELSATKNHKVIKNDEDDMIVVKNTHEPIVCQELWDRVREMEQSVSQGKRNSSGYVANLSGLIYCQDCGNKVRLAWNNTTNGSKKKPRKYLRHNYNCTSYMKFGKRYCLSHYIKMQDMDAIVLEDIRSLAQLVVEDEEKYKAEFLARKAKHHEEQYSVDTKKFTEGRFRLQELTREMCLVSRLMPMSRCSPVRSTSTTNCSMNL